MAQQAGRLVGRQADRRECLLGIARVVSGSLAERAVLIRADICGMDGWLIGGSNGGMSEGRVEDKGRVRMNDGRWVWEERGRG